MAKLCVLEYANRRMQRLGFLKHLVARCGATSTAHLEAVGRDLMETVTRRATVPLTDDLADYIRLRLPERGYAEVRAIAQKLVKTDAADRSISVEIQDFYLAREWVIRSAPANSFLFDNKHFLDGFGGTSVPYHSPI